MNFLYSFHNKTICYSIIILLLYLFNPCHLQNIFTIRMKRVINKKLRHEIELLTFWKASREFDLQ